MAKTRNQLEAVSTVPRRGPIDSACDEFDDDLKQGLRPAIEDFLAGWDEPERSKLLYELVRLEIEHRHRHGQPLHQHDYLRRFPEDRMVLDEAFQMTASLATLAPGYSAETLVIHSTLGDLRYHDRGGLGVVYLAEDRQFKRSAAVKFIQNELAADSRSREQFLLEAEITGRLEHPGVVPVHGLGETADGRLFYVMRFIQGETLDEAIARFHHQGQGRRSAARDRQVPFHELLNRFIAVCKTIAYAHNRGVVHRDIKPGNVMLGRYGETIVIDWGLAASVGRKGVFKDSDEKTLMPSNASGSSKASGGGTPPYMSPEQASGKEELGPATDIYSLGATLYTILTGKAPFSGSLDEIKQRVIRGDFARPTQIKKDTSKALEAICLKAMSREPHQRYATALEVAEDVECFLADAPVSAYDEPIGRRLARWGRRNRTLAHSALVALILLAVVGSLAAAWWGRQAHREGKLHAQAEQARQNEQTLRRQSLQVSAEFAARSIANQIDVRWRILEKEAADPRLHGMLQQINAEPENTALHAPLQAWLDERASQHYANVLSRSWFVQSYDGTQVARYPSTDEDGQPMYSLGGNYAFRDYFHGSGRDYSPQEQIMTRPLRRPHNSTTIRSTNGGDLAVAFSVPIRAANKDEVMGVLAITIELGRFADLQMKLPAGQAVLLVESRKYYVLNEDLEDEGERGEGLVLHHENLHTLVGRTPLPHVDDAVIHFMREAKKRKLSHNPQAVPTENLLPDDYRDPVSKDSAGRWLAAFAPVFVSGRPADQQDTGWYVIVQQRQ